MCLERGGPLTFHQERLKNGKKELGSETSIDPKGGVWSIKKVRKRTRGNRAVCKDEENIGNYPGGRGEIENNVFKRPKKKKEQKCSYPNEKKKEAQ